MGQNSLQPEISEKQMAREQEWEHSAVSRGVARYRRTANNMDNFAETRVGRRVCRDVLPKLIEGIKEYQETCTAAVLTNSGGAPASQALMVNALSAECFAVITAKASLASHGMTGTSLAILIGKRCEEQRQYDLWQDAERQKVKDAKEAGFKAVNVFKLMQERTSRMSRSTIRRWRKRCGDFDKNPWTLKERTWLGSQLLHILVTHGGGWFEMDMVRRVRGGRYVTERMLKLSDAANAWIADAHSEEELRRPWLVPMLVPPKPWEYKDD